MLLSEGGAAAVAVLVASKSVGGGRSMARDFGNDKDDPEVGIDGRGCDDDPVSRLLGHLGRGCGRRRVPGLCEFSRGDSPSFMGVAPGRYMSSRERRLLRAFSFHILTAASIKNWRPMHKHAATMCPKVAASISDGIVKDRTERTIASVNHTRCTQLAIAFSTADLYGYKAL
jgi:hypothetical protein